MERIGLHVFSGESGKLVRLLPMQCQIAETCEILNIRGAGGWRGRTKAKAPRRPLKYFE